MKSYKKGFFGALGVMTGLTLFTGIAKFVENKFYKKEEESSKSKKSLK